MFNLAKSYKVLGKGAQAIVISAETQDGKKVAIKKPIHIEKKISGSSGIINMKELYILSCIKHPYIQRASQIFFKDPFPTKKNEIDVGYTFDKVFFVMDMATHSMHELIHENVVSISTIKRGMFQIACAVQYLHGIGICHRDIKPGNILCYYDQGVLTCRLADFGMTKPLSMVSQNSLHAGTSFYRAPELMMQNKYYGYAMDVWALGCTFFEMAAKQPIFRGGTEIELLMSIFMKRGSPDEETMRYLCSGEFKINPGRHKPVEMYVLLNLPPNTLATFTTENDIENNMHNPGTLRDFCMLLDSMLQVDPRKRPKMDAVVLHDFFKGHFQSHPLQHGLWKPERSTINQEFRSKELGNTLLEYPEMHPQGFWESGMTEILNIESPHGFYTQETTYSIRFLALDIYNRILIKIEKENQEMYYKKLAWVSAYIASKYYLDEGSAHLWDLFPISPMYIESYEIEEIEKRIIELLDCQIYRPNLFTFIENPCFYSSLFTLAMYPHLVYGKCLAEVMSKFNFHVRNYKNAHPHTPLPY